jgi:hypothetical protein
MKNRVRMFFILIFLLMLVACNDGESAEPNPMPKEMPIDFEFSLKYGTYGKKKIDTFNDTVVKDLVEDGTIKANIQLSKSEMERIYKKMRESGIFGEINLKEKPDKKDAYCSGVEPPNYTKWRIKADGEIITVNYNSAFCKTEDLEKLKKLEHYIHEEILMKNEEFLKLPESSGGYG